MVLPFFHFVKSLQILWDTTHIFPHRSKLRSPTKTQRRDEGMLLKRASAPNEQMTEQRASAPVVFTRRTPRAKTNATYRCCVDPKSIHIKIETTLLRSKVLGNPQRQESRPHKHTTNWRGRLNTCPSDAHKRQTNMQVNNICVNVPIANAQCDGASRLASFWEGRPTKHAQINGLR